VIAVTGSDALSIIRRIARAAYTIDMGEPVTTNSAGGSQLTQTFIPCIPASAANTSITITTTADGTATGVDVKSWGCGCRPFGGIAKIGRIL
jgi:hypothetical protein